MPKIQYGKTIEVPLDTDDRRVWFLLQHIEYGFVVNECLGGKTHKKLHLCLASHSPSYSRSAFSDKWILHGSGRQRIIQSVKGFYS